MPAPPPDPSDRTTGFGPNRHRMEIELMEKRFRERSDRHGGGPAATGEIDGRVSDEMRQFFETSTQTLQNVVPQLQEGGSGEGMIETTGEIRKKIDEFFAEPRDPAAAQASAPAAAPPAPAPAPVEAPQRRTKFTGELPAREPAPPAPPVRGRASLSPPASAVPASWNAPRPVEDPSAAQGAEAGQMDLRTALEKLRRHGASKGSETPVARPAVARPAPSPVAKPAFAAPPQRTAAAPAPAPSPAPRREPPPREAPAPLDEGAPMPQRAAPARRDPPPRQADPASAPRANAAVPPAEDRARREPPAPQPAAQGAPRPKGTSDRLQQLSQLPPLTTDEIQSLPAVEAVLRAPRGAPMDVTPSPRPAAGPPRRAPAPALAPAGPDPGEKFDSIFDEVQGIVLDTLKVSVNETFAAARASESELAAVAVPTAEPTSGPISEAVSQSVSKNLARPQEDEEEESDETPSAPYNWKVKSAAKPKGAWLLDTPDDTVAPEAPPQTVTHEVQSSAKAPASGGASSGGARGYLLRKASDEVKRFQPVLKALRQGNLIGDAEIGAKPAAPAAGANDEFVSAASFKDNRPSPEEIEEELSPMRLVEELRRLKRITQALLDKGVISADDLKKAAAD